MNLRFVEAFYWVAAFKSMTRAAEKLFLTQSAVSSRVTALEEELGVLLIDRREKQFRLTTAGLRFLSYAERLLALQRDLRAEMRSGVPARSALRIGAIESVLHTWLIPLVESLRKDDPALELELTVETTPVLMEQLRRGSLDLVFAAMPVSGDGIRSLVLPAMEMVFVGRARPRRRLRLRDLAEEEILTFQRGSQPHVALMDLFKVASIEPKRVHSVSSISAMVRLIESGFGIATLPRPAAEQLRMERRGFAIIGCDTRLPSLPLHASYRLDPGSSSLEPIVRIALEFVRRHKKG